MFIDVCFPRNNEKRFIEIGEKIGTKGLVFLYDNKSKIPKIKNSKIKTWQFCLNNNQDYSGKEIIFRNNLENISKKKNIIYFYEGFKKIIKNFHSPTKNITQVKIKTLKEQEKLFGISFNYILTCSAEELEIMSFILRLCMKYNLTLFLASFAKNPLALRSEQELKSVLNELKIKNKNVLHNLFFHLK